MITRGEAARTMLRSSVDIAFARIIWPATQTSIIGKSKFSEGLTGLSKVAGCRLACVAAARRKRGIEEIRRALERKGSAQEGASRWPIALCADSPTFSPSSACHAGYCRRKSPTL